MKLKKIIFLVGLPGSGKTHYGNEISKKKDTIFLDDFNGNLNELSIYSETYKTIIIADPKLCRNVNNYILKCTNIIKINFGKIEIEWVLWENNIKKAWENVCKRNDGRKISYTFMESLSKQYKPPKITKKIWQTNENKNWSR